MEPKKYQGYAQSTGFNPMRVPDTVSRIAADGERVLRGMQENKQQLAENQSRYISGLERKFSLEQQNRNELEAFQQQQRERVNQDELRNIERSRGIDPGTAGGDIKALAEFSKTLSDLLVNQAKEKAEQDLEKGKELAYLYGLPTDQVQQFDQQEQKLQQTHEAIQEIADKAQKAGHPYEAVEQLRGLSGWKLYGRSIGLLEQASNAYPDWLKNRLDNDTETTVQLGDQQFTPAEAGTIEKKAAASAQLRMEFMRKNGLTSLNTALLNKYFYPTVYKSEQIILGKLREGYIKEQQQTNRDEIVSSFTSNPSKGLIFGQSIIDLQRQGLDKTEARKLLWKNVQDIDQLDDIGNSISWDGKTTWGKKYQLEFLEARRELLRTKKADEDLKDGLLDQELENWTDQFLQELNSKPYDKKVVEQIIDQSRQLFNGKVDSRLESYLSNQTLQARTKKEHEEALWDLYERNELTVEELRSGKYSGEIRSEWMGRAEEQDKFRTPEITKARKAGEEGIVNELRRRANLMQAGSTPHWSYGFTREHALKQLDIKAKAYMSSGQSISPDEAYSKAAQDVIAQIDKDNPKDKQGFGVYSIDKGKHAGEGAFITYTSGGSGGKGGLSEARANVNYIRQRVLNGGRAAVYDQNKPLISRSIAESLVNPDAPIPPVISIIKHALPQGKEMSEFDIIDAQLAAHKLPKRIRPYVQQVVETQLPPRLQSLLYRTPDAFRTRRALTEGGIVGPGQERQAVLHIANQLGVNPADVATFINYETNGDLVSGKYRRGLDRWGGLNGQYFGWIQFSPDNQTKYGVRPGMSSMEMADAVVKYLKNAGVRRGDSLDMLYQAVQAPALMGQARSKGRNIGADSNGSISSHVARMRREHSGPAEAWLYEGANDGGRTVYRDPRLLSAPARKLMSQWQMTSGFGSQESFRRSAHEGNDYATPIGTKLSFKQAGVVLEAKPGTNDRSSNGGYGGYIDIRLADGNVVRIGHLSDVLVTKGQRLRPKEVAALTGSTGRSTGPHAHVEHLSGPMGTQETLKGKRNPSWIASQIYADI